MEALEFKIQARQECMQRFRAFPALLVWSHSRMQAAMMHPHMSHRHADAALEIANLGVPGQQLLPKPGNGCPLGLDSIVAIPAAHNVKGRSGCVWERLNPKRAPAAIALEALERLVRKLQAEIAGLQIGFRELCRTAGCHCNFNKGWI